MAAAQSVGLMYGMAFFLPNDKSIGETTFAKSCPQDWLDHYLREGHQEVSPVIGRVHQSVSAYSWALKDWDGLLVGRQRSWAADSQTAGITCGIVIPDRREGHLKLVTLFGNAGSINSDDQRELHYAGLEAAVRMHELGLRSEEGPKVELSAREIECVHWVAAGKNDRDIGEILSISDKTVSTHVERAKRKFGVRTRAQLIVGALRKGLLHP